MNHSVINFLFEDNTQVKQKQFFLFSRIKLFASAYGVWLIVSIILTYTQPNKYASYFTDLPAYLKSLPPFVLSIAYLIIFIPVILLAVAFAFYILSSVIRGMKKSKF